MDAKWVSVAVALLLGGVGVWMKVADGSLKNKRAWGTLGTVFILSGVMVLVVLVVGASGVQFRSPIFFELSSGAVSSGNYFSAGAILFYVLMFLVLVWSGFSVWFSLRKVGSQKAIPVIAFVFEDSWLDRTPGAKFPLKLRTKWINEGDEVLVGKPWWVAEKMPLQGNAMRYKFKIGSNGTECDETSVKRGEQCEIWLGLTPGIEQRQVEDWRKTHQLGALILPVTVGRMTKELRVRL